MYGFSFSHFSCHFASIFRGSYLSIPILYHSEREHSADTYVDNAKWEFKSPTAKHTKTILKNLKESKWQANYVVLDSRRMKRVPNAAIFREVIANIKQIPEIKRLKYISKKGKLLDVKP
ncbi:hypothetical protein IJG01_02460 [Candidatus Saccharibacteria bacterium]|nr:hypothetical protein [Candidatus Saccharibacteria bacterium]